MEEKENEVMQDTQQVDENQTVEVETGADESTEGEVNQNQTEEVAQEQTEENSENNIGEETATQTTVEEKSAKQKKVKKEKTAKEPKPKKKTRAEKKAEQEAARELEYSNLTEDEIYTKIQTEKLVKRKKRNKLVTLISLCFVFVIAVSVIVMAAVPVSLKPKCIDSGFSRVQIYPGTTTTKINCYKDSERFDEFMKVYDEAFSQPYISALFSGTLFSYNIEEKWENVPSINNLTNNDTYIVHLTYSENQTLTYQNGKAYKSNYWVEKWPNSELTFTDVWFELSKKDGMQDTTVYIAINNYPKFSDGEFSGYKTEGNLVKITIKGNTKLIYDACDELEKLSGESK